MDRYERGDLNESRFYSAACSLKTKHPQFILSVKKASVALDARGVDFIVRIIFPGDPGGMSVPIQVKSSKIGVSKWREKYPQHEKVGVLVFYLRANMLDEDLENLIYRALDWVRHNNQGGKRYEKWFTNLFKGGSRRLKENMRLIREHRASKRY